MTDSKNKTDKSNKFEYARVSLPIECYRYPYNEHRRNTLARLSSIGFDSSSLEERREKLLKAEQSIYEKSINYSESNKNYPSWDNFQFINTYNFISFEIIKNLEGKKIGSVERVGYRESKDIIPEIYKAYSFNKKTLDEVIEKKYSKIYKCPKCGERKCTMENRYNRSLDEGTNLTIKCVSCGNEWNG